MGGNAGENLTLIVLYIFILGLGGAVIIVVRIKILDYIANKKSRRATDKENGDSKISN